MESPRSSPVRKALTEPRLIAGAEYSLLLFNVAGLFFSVLVFKTWLWILGFFVVHIILVYVAKDDAEIRKVYFGYSRQRDKYDPWPHASQRRGHRPFGFGRGETC